MQKTSNLTPPELMKYPDYLSSFLFLSKSINRKVQRESIFLTLIHTIIFIISYIDFIIKTNIKSPLLLTYYAFLKKLGEDKTQAKSEKNIRTLYNHNNVSTHTFNCTSKQPGCQTKILKTYLRAISCQSRTNE